MRTITFNLLFAAMLLCASALTAASGWAQPAATRCEACGKLLGKEVPETELSADPEFKIHGMFQVCQPCMDKKMERTVQATYNQVARRYKWSSIAHNKALASKSIHSAPAGPSAYKGIRRRKITQEQPMP